MAKCPVCQHELTTPFILNVDAWRWLTCPQCAARLERKNPRSAVVLMPLWVGLIAFARLGHRFEVAAEVLMAVILVVIFAEFMRPRLQLRKPLPKPETTLNLGGPSN